MTTALDSLNAWRVPLLKKLQLLGFLKIEVLRALSSCVNFTPLE
jgi:hypothetical protein